MYAKCETFDDFGKVFGRIRNIHRLNEAGVLDKDKAAARFQVGSIEGRVGVQHLEEGHESKKLYLQMPQRKQCFLLSQLYKLSSCASHISAAGSDGSISFWDKHSKKRLKAPQPSFGPHKSREYLPLIIILLNWLKYPLTYREVISILMQQHVLVDGKVGSTADDWVPPQVGSTPEDWVPPQVGSTHEDWVPPQFEVPSKETAPELTLGEPDKDTAPELTLGEPDEDTEPELTLGEPDEDTEPELTLGEPDKDTAPELTVGKPDKDTAPELTLGEPMRDGAPELKLGLGLSLMRSKRNPWRAGQRQFLPPPADVEILPPPADVEILPPPAVEMGPSPVLKLGEPMRDGAPELKLGKLIRDLDSLLFMHSTNQPSRQALSNLAHSMRETIDGEYLPLKLDIKKKVEDAIDSVLEYLSGDQVTEEECDIKLDEFKSIITLILDSMDEDVTSGGSGAGPKIGEVD